MTPKAVRERWPWVGSFLGGTGSHEFVKAVRRGDVAHATVPHLPTLDDGLRNQEIIAAARLSEK
ncbi:MAG: hypothetical protein GY801_01320, partial [bacterium]|nr:hypothetical protein [bacterium]